MPARGALGRFRSVGLTGLAVVAGAGAYLSASVAGVSTGAGRRWLLLLGALLTVATLLLQRRTDRRRRSAEQVAVEAEEALTLALNGALAPLTAYLGELAVAEGYGERAALAGQLRQGVVDAAVKLVGEGARSAFYQLDEGARSLSRVVWSGRATMPRGGFTAGTSDGDFVLDLVLRRDLVFIDDVQTHPLVEPSVDSGYQTVIAVAVPAGHVPLGLLTVDAVGHGDLVPSDLELIRVLANLLGAGLAQTRN